MESIQDLCLSIYIAEDAEPIPYSEEYWENIRSMEQQLLTSLFESTPSLNEVSLIPQQLYDQRPEFKTINKLPWPFKHPKGIVLSGTNLDSFYSWLVETNLSEIEFNIIKKVFFSLTDDHMMKREKKGEVVVYERSEFIK